MPYTNEVTDYRTSAPDGVYIAISRQPCDVTGAKLVTQVPLVVLQGKVLPETVDLAAKSFVPHHPDHCFLEYIKWDGEDAFLLVFGS